MLEIKKYINDLDEIKPNIEIEPSVLDITHIVKSFETLSKISFLYYDNPNFADVILKRNPELKSEFDIQDSQIIYIPMPITRLTKFINFGK